ncbi:hypothetical protein TWF102_005634 [Orbilia oligospora]|uniref:Phosphate transporter n=1 Tax=Orbilia oligospora TaxID=2813651 RepID=A0A7C8JL99_ORBOL|nr:hypothetical protein TWF103_011659 [Orbilia oligospora]KAF3099230.1 hypothetical protein TWF102_005634 [Orbilia oligospora]
MAPPATAKYVWILAITTIAFVFSAFGNGANDVANAYATSVAARTLTMPQVGILSMLTEFAGAVGLGSRVTSTIKNGIINIDRFNGNPGTLMLAMGCAEVASATWLMLATGIGFPVSTTQTIVGALVGVGFATEANIKWGWQKGSVSQIAASWGVAPAIACGFSAIIFGLVKYTVLERKDSFKWAMRLIPFFLGGTGAILTLFIIAEAPSLGSFEEFGAGQTIGVVLGVFAGLVLIGYVFFIPYFERRLIHKDARVKFWHIPLGPLLRRENPPLYFPGKADGEYVTDYYADPYETSDSSKDEPTATSTGADMKIQPVAGDTTPTEGDEKNLESQVVRRRAKPIPGPHERFLHPVAHLPLSHPSRIWGYVKFGFLQGVTRDCVTHDSEHLREVHARAHRYDSRVEHLWTYCQVASAMMMSIAHGSNDVANAVGPWAAVYQTYKEGAVATTSPTPIWFLVVAGFLLGAGFWFYGYNIIRALGNKITQMSPTRGFSTELGAAITVLLASQLGLPISTTQTLAGATLGVALMNYDVGAVNWRQLGWIFLGWVLTLPAAGLFAGLLCAMALNAPRF